MQSPKFKFLKGELEEVFSESSLKEEWSKRVKYQIRKQAIFDPIEYRDYNENIIDLVDGVKNEVMNGHYQVKPAKRFLYEKSRGLCRQMTLVHPQDLLVLERLSRSFYFELKEKCPSKSAFFEPDDGNFVRGLQGGNLQYGSFASWKKFQKEVFGFAKENKYIVVTDVANFYDFINFQHLRNIISSLADVREAVLDLLIFVLNRLTWMPDFMPLTQTGMPQIETNATRVLANALLYEVDRVCEYISSLNYARFMDDMDVGVDSIPQAKIVIRDIDLTLQSRQLRLNSSKTKILSQIDAYKHFCILENIQLSRLEKILSNSKWKTKIGLVLKRKYERWLDRTPQGGPGSNSKFTAGNGSKIHKRILALIYQIGERVSEDDLLWLIKNDPAMRSVAFRYLARSWSNNFNFVKILKWVEKGVFVDDSSIIELSYFLLHGKFVKTKIMDMNIERFIAAIKKDGDIKLHCAIFVSSKYQNPDETLKILSENVLRIRSDFWLARAAAGVAPKFMNKQVLWGRYIDFIKNLRNEDADSVLDYFIKISRISNPPQSIVSYLRARNHTFPQGIYYPKLLHLLAAVNNPLAKTVFPNIYSDHPCILLDQYYKDLGF